MASFMDDVSHPRGGASLVLKAAAITGLVVLLLPFQLLCLKLRLPAARLLPMLFHRAAVRIIGLKVKVIGAASADRPMLILANHVSWLDIIALGSVMPLSFIAKAEIGAWPVFGFLSRLQRSIFVDRTRKTGTGKVNTEIAERLAEGDPIILFAESTTSDGNRILPFRSALVGAAQEAILSGGSGPHVCLQPVAIAYTRVDGLPTGRIGRARIGWYGDMDMLPHLASILRGGSIDVEVRFGEPMAFDQGSDRKIATRTAEAEVRSMLAEALTGRKALPVPTLPET